MIRRLQPRSLAKVDGITLYMQPVQDLTVEDRVSRTQYQYTLEDANAEELNTVDDAACGEIAGVAATARRGHRPADPGLAGDLVIDRELLHGSESHRKRSTTRSTMRLASGRSPRFSPNSTSIT